MDIRRSFSSKQNKLVSELYSISENSNLERVDIVKRVSEEFNKISSQSVIPKFFIQIKVLNHIGKRAKFIEHTF